MALFLLLSFSHLLPLLLLLFSAQISSASPSDFFNLNDKTGAVWLYSSSNISMEESDTHVGKTTAVPHVVDPLESSVCRIQTAHARNMDAVSDPDEVMAMIDMRLNESISKRRMLGGSALLNPVDYCWRNDGRWLRNRQALADCSIGFGRNAIGGKNGRFYVVTDAGDDDPVNPVPGTIRHAVIQKEPLWIVFKRSMTITLKEELIFNSYKTVDGRGANVEIAYGGCLTLQFVTNIIIHGITIHNCVPTGNALVRDSPSHFGYRTIADGDGISIFGSSMIWIDHVTLYHCADGLIDAVMGSTAISITNNYFSHHNEVMLMGHNDSYQNDKIMQVTIAYNHFGEHLIQRMPRCRYGSFQVVNNDYTHWEMYALGGSSNPTINSQGNRYIARDYAFSKEVTKRLGKEGYKWNWRSRGDLLLNGASFLQSGQKTSGYARASSIAALSATLVPQLTSDAGALNCRAGYFC